MATIFGINHYAPNIESTANGIKKEFLEYDQIIAKGPSDFPLKDNDGAVEDVVQAIIASKPDLLLMEYNFHRKINKRGSVEEIVDGFGLKVIKRLREMHIYTPAVLSYSTGDELGTPPEWIPPSELPKNTLAYDTSEMGCINELIRAIHKVRTMAAGSRQQL